MADQLDTALTHVSTLYGLYITQRQNVVNFYLAGIALLSVAYVAALDKGRAVVVVAVCALAVLSSVAAYFQDKNLRRPMELAEEALCALQGKLAEPPPGLPAVEIQAAIEASKGKRRMSRGLQIRLLYGVVAVVFVLGGIYPFIAR